MTLTMRSDGESLTAAEWNEVVNRQNIAHSIRPTVADLGAQINTILATDDDPIIQLEPGTYTSLTAVVVADGKALTLLGAGKAQTLINHTAASDFLNVNGSNTGTRCKTRLEAFQLIGPGSGTVTNGIKIANSQRYLYIHEVKVSAFGTGCLLTQTWNGQVSSFLLTGCGTGLHLSPASGEVNAIAFIDLECESNTIGMKMEGSHVGNTFTGCLFEGNTTSEIEFTDSGGSAPKSQRFLGCYFERSTAARAIYITGTANAPRNIEFISCNFSGDYTHGARVNRGQRIRFIHCAFYSATMIPVYTEANAENVVVIDPVETSVLSDLALGTQNHYMRNVGGITEFVSPLAAYRFTVQHAQTATSVDIANNQVLRVVNSDQTNNNVVIFSLAGMDTAGAIRKGAFVGAVLHDRGAAVCQADFIAGYSSGDSFTEGMRITSGGNIGFFSTTPQYKVDLGSGDVRIRSGALLFGGTTGAADADVSLSRGAANRLDVAAGDGFRLIGGTAAQRDALTLADGIVWYNTDTNKLQVRAAGAWVDLH